MPTFGQQFHATLAGGAGMLEGFKQLGGAVGGIGGQIKEKRFQTELSNIDTNTPAGQIEYQQKLLAREKDPRVRLQIQSDIGRLREQQAAGASINSYIAANPGMPPNQIALLKAGKITVGQSNQINQERIKAAGTKNVIGRLRSANASFPNSKLDQLADDVESGVVTSAAARKTLSDLENNAKEAAQGLERRKVFLKSKNISLEGEGTIFTGMSEETLSALTPATFVAFLKDADESNKTNAIAANLKKEGHKEIARELEQGLLKRSDVLDRLKNDLTLTNTGRILYDGKIVNKAKVSRKRNGEKTEFMGYQDPETGEWLEADPAKVEEIPKNVKNKIQDIAITDLKKAAQSLSSLPEYLELSIADQKNAQYAFALEVQDKINKLNTQDKADDTPSLEEIYENAKTSIGGKIEKGTIGAGWFSIDSFTFDNKKKTADWSELG